MSPAPEVALKLFPATVLPAIVLIACAAACAPVAPPLSVSNAIYRAPLGASGVGVAYVSITSARPDRIVAVSSPLAAAVEMHASMDAVGQSRMERLESVPLPAGEPVIFAPRGMHFMVFSPQNIPAGATFPIQIELESGVKEVVAFQPAPAGAAAGK